MQYTKNFISHQSDDAITGHIQLLDNCTLMKDRVERVKKQSLSIIMK